MYFQFKKCKVHNVVFSSDCCFRSFCLIKTFSINTSYQLRQHCEFEKINRFRQSSLTTWRLRIEYCIILPAYTARVPYNEEEVETMYEYYSIIHYQHGHHSQPVELTSDKIIGGLLSTYCSGLLVRTKRLKPKNQNLPDGPIDLRRSQRTFKKSKWWQ